VRLAFACLAAFAAALAVQVDQAPACSCAQIDPRSALDAADAAFVGTLVERRGRGDAGVTLVFWVEQAVKGRLGARVEVETASNGAACGIEVDSGTRIGLFLERSAGRWYGSLCGQVEPERLRAAARPLPRPNGQGPAALLVGGRFGLARTIALDGRGRTLAYGMGAGETLFLAACPGSRRAVELVYGDRVLLAVRDLRTLRVVRQRTLPLAWGGPSPAGLWCRDREAHDLLVFATDLNRPAGSARVLRVASSGVSTVWRGTALSATALGDRVYLAAGMRADRLLVLEPGSGRARQAATLPRFTGSLSASPDGRRVAGVAYSAPLRASSPASRAVLVDLTGSPARVRTAPLGRPNVSGRLLWPARDRVVFLPDGEVDLARLYDLSLRVRASFRGWAGRGAALVGTTAWGVGYDGRVIAARLPRGPVRTVRELPSPVARVLAAVP
jgi:hypothetical protein